MPLVTHDTVKLSSRVLELHASSKLEERIAAVLMDRAMGEVGLSEYDALEKARHVVALLAMELR